MAAYLAFLGDLEIVGSDAGAPGRVLFVSAPSGVVKVNSDGVKSFKELCGLNSLYSLRQASIFQAASSKDKNGWPTTPTEIFSRSSDQPSQYVATRMIDLDEGFRAATAPTC